MLTGSDMMDVIDGGLARVSLFSHMDQAALGDIEARCNWARVPSGSQIFDKDSDTLEVYFVVEGAVRILTTGADEREVALADVIAGNYFGELAAIDGMKRSARVVATKDTVLASLEGGAFLDLMRQYPPIAIKVVERLTRIVRSLDTRVAQLSSQNESQRVWGEILRLAQPDPAQPESWQIADLPNHKEIAAWAGTSREKVAQAIGELAREGVVRRRSMGLLICDLARLQLMAASRGAA
ncbi:Crp/Fnr family transcriptional regulator [Paramagnetospirillum magneticum]|nr:Crp/Fnr family transcriptional regulator [Paramagnetospirillum magneticum]